MSHVNIIEILIVNNIYGCYSESMSSFRLIDPAQEIVASLTEDCVQHDPEDHRGLVELFRALDSETAFNLLRQVQAMPEVEKFLSEKLAIRMGTRSVSSVAPDPRKLEAIALALMLIPLSVEISRGYYCPEFSAEIFKTDVSLISQCVNAIKVFFEDAITASDPRWKDVNLLRGRFLLEACDGFTGQSDEETKWIGEHSLRLATHVLALEACTKIDREHCETLLTTTTPLLDGIL